MEHGTLGWNGTLQEKWNTGNLDIDGYDKLCRSNAESD